MTKVSGYEGETIYLPTGWQRCDGTVIAHPSPWAGKLTPDLNNEKRFLRGGHDGDQLKLEEDTVAKHSHISKDKYFLGHYKEDCPAGEVEVEEIEVENSASQELDDKICERSPTTEESGDFETKPKNMNVIFIIRIF